MAKSKTYNKVAKQLLKKAKRLEKLSKKKTKKSKKSKKNTMRIKKGHKRAKSLTHKGYDYVTHKGDKKFNRNNHRQSFNLKGYIGKPYKKKLHPIKTIEELLLITTPDIDNIDHLLKNKVLRK